jgi:hypothetical protein
MPPFPSAFRDQFLPIADHGGDTPGDPVSLTKAGLGHVLFVLARTPEELNAGTRVELGVKGFKGLVVFESGERGA